MLFIACNSNESQPAQKEKSETLTSTTNAPDKTKYGRKNFAVVNRWTATDVKEVEAYLPTMSDELMKLWKEGTVVNAYFNTGEEEEKLDYIPNIAFFIKAQDKTNAQSILNDLTAIKNNLGEYDLVEVGTLWLNRKDEAVRALGTTKTFVTIWTTADVEIDDNLLKEQNDRILSLWKEGRIENVYFDIEGTQTSNSTKDFVFFVNANTLEEAEEICNALPFAREGVATYKSHNSGTFWMGEYQE